MTLMRILFAFVCLGSLLFSQEPGVSSALDSKVKAKIAGFKGRISLYAKNLNTGAFYSLAGDEPVRTASTIKFPIMIECFAEAG